MKNEIQGEKTKKDRPDRETKRGTDREKEVLGWPRPHSLGRAPRLTVQVLRFSPIYIKTPGTQDQEENRVERLSDAEKERSAHRGLRKN